MRGESLCHIGCTIDVSNASIVSPCPKRPRGPTVRRCERNRRAGPVSSSGTPRPGCSSTADTSARRCGTWPRPPGVSTRTVFTAFPGGKAELFHEVLHGAIEGDTAAAHTPVPPGRRPGRTDPRPDGGIQHRRPGAGRDPDDDVDRILGSGRRHAAVRRRGGRGPRPRMR